VHPAGAGSRSARRRRRGANFEFALISGVEGTSPSSLP